MSKEAADLLRCILCTDPEKRYKIADIRKHSWFNMVPYKSDQKRRLRTALLQGTGAPLPMPLSSKLLNIMEGEY